MIFVRGAAKKDVHTVRDVEVEGHEVACPCGTKWLCDPIDSLFSNPVENVCPDCGTSPKPGRIGPLALFKYDVPITFGNVVGKRPTSFVLVTPPKR